MTTLGAKCSHPLVRGGAAGHACGERGQAVQVTLQPSWGKLLAGASFILGLVAITAFGVVLLLAALGLHSPETQKGGRAAGVQSVDAP